MITITLTDNKPLPHETMTWDAELDKRLCDLTAEAHNFLVVGEIINSNDREEIERYQGANPDYPGKWSVTVVDDSAPVAPVDIIDEEPAE